MSYENPVRAYFAQVVDEAISKRLRIAESQDVVGYLSNLLTEFMRMDTVYAVRDLDGLPVKSITGMAAEGDVLLNADSFEREREVHKHLGDFLLFFSGMYPEQLRQMLRRSPTDSMIDPIQQGRLSYSIAGSFTYPPHDRESPTLQKLSERFDAYQASLLLVRANLGWTD